jgi:hypothetical protein
LKLLAWDIENSAPTSRPWGLFNQNIGLSQVIDPGRILSFAARWYGTPKSAVMFSSVYHDGQQQMLEKAYDLLDEADALISWNGAKFDTRKINWEFELFNIRDGGKYSPVKEIDLMKNHKREFQTLSNKLEFVAAQLLGETKVTHEGFKLWLAVEGGNPRAWDKFKRYNIQDVNLLIKLYDRMLPWLQHPNQNLFNRTEGACPSCGKFKLEEKKPHYTLTRAYYQYQCTSCKSWSKGKEIPGSRALTTRLN